VLRVIGFRCPEHWLERSWPNNTHLVTAALALGGTRQGEPRRDKQSGQGREPGATPGGSWWPIDRRQQCHRSCQTASSDARFAASSWRRGGRGVGVTATSKPFTMPTIRMHQSTYSYVPEMRGQSPCPYAVQRSPSRQSEKRLQLALHAKCCWLVGRHAMVRKQDGIGPLGDQLGKPPKRKYLVFWLSFIPPASR
jgi:hypothetical protein